MWIGAGRIVLDFYGNESQSLKKKNLDDLCKDLRKKFNLSALEIAEFDDPERCVLGFSATMPQHWSEENAQAFIAKICKYIDDTAFARVTGEESELYSLGDHN